MPNPFMDRKIETHLDPQFQYPYQQTKFVPPDGTCLLMMGQTEERIQEYVHHFKEHPIPGAWSAYWGITEFKGITESFTNDTGSSQNHQWILDTFPNTAIHSALWMVGMNNIAQNAADGMYDEVLLQFARWAKSIDRPMYLRIGYEFDGAHNQLDPKTYVKAYRRIVDLFRKEGVDNIAYVWHSYAAKPYEDHPITAWYPGDDYVDWMGISVFDQAYEGTELNEYSHTVLTYAKAHQKPVMLAECNPIKGIATDSSEVWNDWFVNFFSFMYQKNIKAIAFINEDWQSLLISGTSEWKDGRLLNNPQVAEAWFEETQKSRYLKQSPELFEQLGYQKKQPSSS
jgi:hypothetical protein